MEISNDLEFSSEDASMWRQFLKTQSGQRLLPKMLEAIPALLDGGGTNEILIRSGMVKGFQTAAQNLLALAFPQPETLQKAGEYPDLTDNAAWNDGKKIE